MWNRENREVTQKAKWRAIRSPGFFYAQQFPVYCAIVFSVCYQNVITTRYFCQLYTISATCQKTQKTAQPYWVSGFYWRRERDLNPWYSCPYTRFPGVLLRPLGHLSMCFQQGVFYHVWPDESSVKINFLDKIFKTGREYINYLNMDIAKFMYW